MASESSTSAFGVSDTNGIGTEILDNQESKTSRSTVIESSATVVTEKKKVSISQKFTLPHGQNVFLATKMAEAFLEKVQQLSEQ